MNVCYPVLVKFAITSPFSFRTKIKTSEGYSSSNHKGVDLDVLKDTDHDYVVSCTDGIVESVGYTKYRGNYVFVKNNDGGGCLYQHLDKISVSKGQNVSCKSILGIMGSTGNVSGKHLHFEVTTQTSFNGLTLNGGQFNPAIFWGIQDYGNLKGKIFDGSGMITGLASGQLTTNLYL